MLPAATQHEFLHDATAKAAASSAGVALVDQRELAKLPVFLISKKMTHHSPHSGYDRLLHYLPGLPRLDSLPGVWNRRLATWKYRKHIAPNCPSKFYSRESYLSELPAIRHMRKRSGSLYHFIYGEDQFLLSGDEARKRGNKVVATFHQPASHDHLWVTDKRYLKSLDAAVTVSTSQNAWFADILGADRVHYVPHGVDVEFFAPPTNDARHAAGGAPRRTCLVVGSWLRDWDTLHRVIDLLRDRAGSSEPVKFVIVTKPDHVANFRGCDNAELKMHISETELLSLYQTCDLTVLPFLDSTANNVLLESLACGTPVVATDIGGVHDYLDATCGVTSPAKDAAAMAQAIRALLDDAVRWRTLSIGARRRAQRFDWRAVAGEMAAVYRRVLGKA